MTKIDIISGFLGAGKTTLIKKLIKEAYAGEKVVLIENEFGEIGVDGGFLKDAGIEITEMNSGCICCSLVGDFAKALKEVEEKFSPDRIVIEPSGVGKLSDVIRAVQRAGLAHSELNAFCTVVDAKKCKMYLKNFGEFFLDQVENASCIILSHTALPHEKLDEAVALLRGHTQATIVTTEWEKLDGKELLAAMEQRDSLRAELERLAKEAEEHAPAEHDECCHHHHHDEGECCHHDHEHEHGECHHHHDHEEGECHHHHHEEGECHHHHHDEGECCHHDHDHEHEGECHHHHHHADEVFASWGTETAKKFTKEELEGALEALSSGEYGDILRAKGYVDGEEGWIYFDYVPGEPDLRSGEPSVTGRLCVIGCHLAEDKLKALFLG
ncbi:MAG TPA: GTP-binding protein [Candidatus Gallimonas gallistercoris]|uniref:GTP-binding protein n=1 Tax=Candidatus Gallimonas gallistercoris TaxID=2838602 RepID=A0A9D2KGK8_9FIRM|nr:GTP-binding protein [Candidatus Gallimonas gallistercoris]